MDHPPYSPNFALIDWHPFGHLKQHLDRKRSASDTSVEKARHQFLLQWDISLGTLVGQMLKCQWWLHGGLMCTMLHLCHVYIRFRINSGHQIVCYLILLTAVYFCAECHAQLSVWKYLLSVCITKTWIVVFIFGLLGSTVSTADCTTLSDGVTDESQVGKDLDGSSCGLTEVLS